MTHPGVARCRGDVCCLRLRCLLPGGEPDHHCVVPSGQTVETTIPREWKDKKWLTRGSTVPGRRLLSTIALFVVRR